MIPEFFLLSIPVSAPRLGYNTALHRGGHPCSGSAISRYTGDGTLRRHRLARGMILSHVIAQYHWHAGIGDPTVAGWITVVAYAVAAWLALKTGLQTAPSDLAQRGRRRLWLSIAGLMAFLCLNKQLDLQTLFTDIGRTIATDEGWYEQRRGVQRSFVLGVLGISMLTGIWFVFRHRAFWGRHKLLVSGLWLLLTFIIIRAISFHHFDVINQESHFGIRLNSVLELGGIFLVALAAARARREGPPRQAAQSA